MKTCTKEYAIESIAKALDIIPDNANISALVMCLSTDTEAAPLVMEGNGGEIAAMCLTIYERIVELQPHNRQAAIKTMQRCMERIKTL